MKVLLDAHRLNADKGGIERYTKNLIFQLGKHVQLVAYTNKSWKISTKDNLSVSEPIKAYVPLMDNGLYRMCFGFNKAIKKYRPDILHVQNFSPIIQKVPIVNTVHDLCFKDFSNTFALASIIAFKFFFEKSLFHSDIIICPSLHVKSKLTTNYDVDSKRVRVIYEGIDPVFRQIINDEKFIPIFQKKYNLNKPYFLVVGGFNKRKNIPHIIHAFQELSKQFKDINLVVVGSANVLQQDKNIIYINNVSDQDLNILYNRAVSLIYYSSCEGFGLPLIEAMATGLPVIHSGLDVFEEIAGDVGLIANTDRDLVLVMKTLLTNPQLRDRCVSMGLLKSKNYSWERNAKQTSDIYEEVYKKYPLID